LLFVLVTLALSIQMERREVMADATITISADNRVGFHRAQVETLLTNAVSVVGVSAYGSAVLDNESLNGTVQLNTATFGLQTPATGNDLGFYFGFLEASASWQVSSSAALGSVSGSLAELMAAFYSVIVYEDRDGSPGFQYDLNAQVLDCSSGTHDCVRVDSGFTIDFKDLTWNAVSKTTFDCTDQLTDPAEGETCTVTVYTMSDNLDNVVFDFKVTTHPLTFDGVELDPDFGKLDVSINYDWTGKDCDNCKLALTAATAGKTTDASFNFDFTSDSATTTATFNVGDLSAYFTWEDTASISGASSTVYVSAVTGADLDAWTCDGLGCLTATTVLNLFWKVALGIWEAFGWDATIIIFSWNDVKPTSVFWDPVVGGDDSNRLDDSVLPTEDNTDFAFTTQINYVFIAMLLIVNLW